MTPEVSPEQIEELASRCYRSRVEFCRIFLPDWFPTKMPWVHRGILSLLTGKTEFLLDFGPEQWRDELAAWTPHDLEKILTNFLDEQTGRPIFRVVLDPEPHVVIDCKNSIGIIMPRGSSKTTLVNANNLADIVYQDEDFFLYASESGGHAERQLGTIKSELEDHNGVPQNELLNLVFGNHKPDRQSPLKWTENYIETLKGVMVGAVGRGGQIRGFGKRAKRPGKIVFDDLEDEESVESPTQRKKNSGWFFNAARPAKKKGGRDIITGTLLHTDAILNKVIKHREFTVVRFGAIDRQGDALWPWYMTLEQLEEKRLAAAEVGELAGFYLEYMSEYRDDEARAFPENKLVYVHKDKSRFVAMSLALDPAISEDRKADMAALACVGIENGGHKHVIESFGQVGIDSDALLEKFFELHFKHMAHLPHEQRKYGIEAIAFQRVLIPMARAKMVEKSKTYGQSAYFEILPIFHGKIAKVPRVQGILKPLIWSGHLTFEDQYGPMHTQLTDWPKGLRDLPDVAAMAIALLDPYVLLGLGNDEEVEVDLSKDTMPPLTVIAGGKSFRSAP
jgi:hypothetical protein